MRQTVSIIGYGRFGRVLHRLLGSDFQVTIFDRKPIRTPVLPAKIARTHAEAYASDVIFYAVPIDRFERIIAAQKKYFEPRHLLIDVLSVKMHPARMFKKYVSGTGARWLLTHPMFGPDSSRDGFVGLPMIMDQGTATTKEHAFWKRFFALRKLRVVEISPREHDRMAAGSQGLTHVIGRVLDVYGMRPTRIDSLGAEKLQEVMAQTCHDTWQLFSNLQQYNPYTRAMRLRLSRAYTTILQSLDKKEKRKGRNI